MVDEDARYMLLGDTYADIMFAHSLIGASTADTAQMSADLEIYSRQLDELSEVSEEADPEYVLKEASYLAQAVEDLIATLAT